MRSYTVIIISLAITILTAFSCAKKFDESPDEMDKFNAGIAGLDRILPPERSFSLQLIESKHEYELYTRYFLVPRRMYYPVIATDTVLIINPIGRTDSVAKYVINNKKVLWQNKDNLNTYTLICSQ